MTRSKLWLCCPQCAQTITHIDVDRDGFICTLTPCRHRFVTALWVPVMELDESDELVLGLKRNYGS